MAIFMPSQITPDVRSGLGLGTIDADAALTVSWRISGQSALVKFQIAIYDNDAASTERLVTGELTDGCPAYGTDSMGKPQLFSYTIPAASLASAGIVNGNEYKLIITQWWSAEDSVTQSSASVFVTRAAPTVSVSPIGTSSVIETRYYTFTGNYSQAQGDVLNWFRWRVAVGADGAGGILYDSGNISGTMDLICQYDGFLSGTDYAVRLTLQTENGVEADTGWVNFGVRYDQITLAGSISASCAGGTDAVLVDWSGIGVIEGEAVGEYSISDDNILTLQLAQPINNSITWSKAGTNPMSFSPPWSLIWKGRLGFVSCPRVFSVQMGTRSVTLTFNAPHHVMTLNIEYASSGEKIPMVTQMGIINAPKTTIVLTPTKLYIRVEYLTGGLYPGAGLYPHSGLYPKKSTVPTVDIYELDLDEDFVQDPITAVRIEGYQECEFIEVIDGVVSAQTIEDAITNGDYTPPVDWEEDYMLANWQNNSIDAGQFTLSDKVTGWALYRSRGEESALVRICELGKSGGKAYDYGALSQQGPYTYHLFPVGETTYISTEILSNVACPVWWNWSLMECAEGENPNIFTVLKAYRFRLNVQNAAISNNNTPALLENFTPYPKIQLSPQNYKSGSLSALIGIVDWTNGQPEYVDTVALANAIMALSVTQNALFLKSRKGELLRVRVSAPIQMQTEDATVEQMQTMTLPWAEVGPAEGTSLYSAEWVAAQEDEAT